MSISNAGVISFYDYVTTPFCLAVWNSPVYKPAELHSVSDETQLYLKTVILEGVGTTNSEHACEAGKLRRRFLVLHDIFCRRGFLLEDGTMLTGGPVASERISNHDDDRVHPLTYQIGIQLKSVFLVKEIDLQSPTTPLSISCNSISAPYQRRLGV
jgi:hypothetical protein